MTLRVGLLHYTSPPVVGGVEIVMGHHARLISDAGHRVRIISGRGSDRRFETVGIPLADARRPAIRALRAELDAGRVPSSFAPIVRGLRVALDRAADGLDVLVAHNVCTMHLNLALTGALHGLATSAAGPPVVAWDHDIVAASPGAAEVLHPGEPWDLVRTPWPDVTHVTISDARRVELAAATGLDATTIAVVPNGLDVQGVLGLHPATRRLIGPLGLPAAGPLLLMPARITPRKNLELAIAVVAELRRAGDDARLLVTGPPDPHATDRNAYPTRLGSVAAKLGVTNAVHFLAHAPGGRTAPRVVADLYRLADVLLITSRDEGFGLPVLEAGACRLPIVCADLRPLRALAGDDATYFDPGADPATIARLVRARLDDAPASRLAARVRSTFSWAAIYATQIEPLLLAVAAGGRTVWVPVGPGPGGSPPGQAAETAAGSGSASAAASRAARSTGPAAGREVGLPSR